VHVAALILLAGVAWPLWLAWRATAHTTLRATMGWLSAAWVAWLLALALRDDLAGYLALSLSACAGIAVLGARRPGVGAWNFVVAGLLAVLLLPMAQAWGSLRVETAQAIFLAAVLAVPILNYLPTRLGPGVILSAMGFAGALVHLAGSRLGAGHEVAHLCVAAGPWLALLTRRWREPRSAFDQTWLRFRDGFGFVWGQRARNQLNRAAENAGLTPRLAWRGLVEADGSIATAADDMLQLLQGVLKRFGNE
jgi:hypothetical protein